MAVYVIGDVQGCFAPLRALVARLNFDRQRDQLWFTGDLVNRGPASLEVLRFVKNLGARAVTVLGNHDLHLLALAVDAAPAKQRDTLDAILRAPDSAELLTWLRTRPLLHHDPRLDATLVHAGLLPQWDLAEAERAAREAEAVIARGAAVFFQSMYGDEPDCWQENLSGADRLRVIVNAFTRLRYCTREGRMDLRRKGAPGTQAPGLLPWFEIPGRRSAGRRVLFGHWSTLGRIQRNNVIALDSGCVWGRVLTAVRIDVEPVQFFEVGCGAGE